MFKVTLAFIFLTNLSLSQSNLIYNGDFEMYSACPNGFSDPGQSFKEIEKCIGWKSPTFGTSDYYNECSLSPISSIPVNGLGNQLAYSGKGYLGAYLTNYNWGAGNDGYNGIMWWEYIQGSLNSPLQSGNLYKLKLKVSLCEYSDLLINEFGAYFSEDPISSNNTGNLQVLPQCVFTNTNYFNDTIDWIECESYFISNGGEKYITLGNFKNNLSTDTLRRFNSEPVAVNPYATYFYFDDIELTDVTQNQETPNVFTPNNDGINDFWVPLFSLQNYEVFIMNRWGSKITILTESNPTWGGKDSNGNSVSNGEYFYLIIDKVVNKPIHQGIIYVLN